MVSVNDVSTDILVVSKNGYGKRSAWKTIELQTGGKGVKLYQLLKKLVL